MEFIYPPTIPRPAGHYSPAAVHNGFVFVSGQISTDAAGKPVLDSIEEQTTRCLEKIKVILTASNSSPDRVLKVNIFVAQMDDWPRVNKAFAEFFGAHRPARIIVPSGLLHYGCGVEIDCVAAVNS